MIGSDVERVLRTVVELTELESALIAERDAAALTMLGDEREALLRELPDALPERCAPLVERFRRARDANLIAATAAAAAIRSQLGTTHQRRKAIGGYASDARERPERGVA